MEEQTKMKIKDWVFLILLLAAIVGLFAAVLTVKQYAVMLNNPLGYSMAKWNYNSCLCYDQEGRVVPIKSINYNITADKSPFQPEYAPSLDLKIGDLNGTGRDN